MTQDAKSMRPLSGHAGVRRYIGPKRLTLLFLFGMFAAAAWYLRQRGLLTPEYVLGRVAQYPVAAPLIFTAAYAATVLFMIPSLPLNLGAGFLWGPVLGSVYSLVGSTIGAVLAFLFARTAIGQPLARTFDNRLLAWLVDEISRKGWRVVAFVRLNPAFPSGPTNYLFGLTSLTLRTYLWSTAVFMYPLCLAFAALGYSVGGIVLDADSAWIVRLVLAASAAASLAVIGRICLKRLQGGAFDKRLTKEDE